MARAQVILLDTHVLVWAVNDDRKLGRKARAAIERHWGGGGVAVSAITFWEAALLESRGRLRLPVPALEWRAHLIAAGLTELPLEGAAGIRAVDLGGLSEDPADRFIVATAITEGAALMSADERMLRWPHPLERQDARA